MRMVDHRARASVGRAVYLDRGANLIRRGPRRCHSAREVSASSPAIVTVMRRAGRLGLRRRACSAGVEVGPERLELESQTRPCLPAGRRYLDTLRWVFIAVALGGIAVTIYARLDDWKRGQR